MSDSSSENPPPTNQPAMSSASKASSVATRFAFVDGLRGTAALGIAVYHIWRYEPLPYPSLQFVPGFVDWLLCRTWIGVQILLVISGFVIAYSLRHVWVTPREAVLFVARRLVRLTPPYWLTLGLVIALNWACVRFWRFPVPFDELLTFKRVLTHMLFLQDVFEQPALSAGIWTVCIEVQFYAVCVLGWGLAQRLSNWRVSAASPPTTWSRLLVFGPFAAMSLLLWSRQDSTEPYVTHFFGLFFLGMTAWWGVERTISSWTFSGVMIAGATMLAVTHKLEQFVGLMVAVSIFAIGRVGHLHDWLNWKWLQHMGKISYSLYLVHYPVSHVLMWWGWELCGQSPTPWQATVILTGCLFSSLVAAQGWYVLIEAPSVRWSARLKTEPQRVVESR